MKRTLLATSAAVALILVSGPAFAGNISEPVMTPAPAPVMAPVMTGTDWSGFYAGGSLGYADVSQSGGGFDDDGATYGLHAGYDYDFGNFVMGGELEMSAFDVSSAGINVDSVTRAKLRAGYDAGNILPYVTAGYAQLNTGGALDVDDGGAFYGLGMDYKFTDSIRVGGEVLKHEFNDYNNLGIDLDATTAAVRVSFEF